MNIIHCDSPDGAAILTAHTFSSQCRSQSIDYRPSAFYRAHVGLCYRADAVYAMTLCLSVCPSVRPSVMRGVGSGKGAQAPPQKNSVILRLKMCTFMHSGFWNLKDARSIG